MLLKKGFPNAVRKARRAAARRGRRLRIMFSDEARFGRMNRIRPCWAPVRTRPEVAVQLIREYIYLYGAVSPKDGTCVYLIMPTSGGLQLSGRALFVGRVRRARERPLCFGTLDISRGAISTPSFEMPGATRIGYRCSQNNWFKKVCRCHCHNQLACHDRRLQSHFIPSPLSALLPLT